MKETKISAKYEDKIASIRDAVREIKSLCKMSKNAILQVIIPCLMHLSETDKDKIMTTSHNIQVLPDFPRVEGLDTGDSVAVSKYLNDNYDIMTLCRHGNCLSYTITMYYRVLKHHDQR